MFLKISQNSQENTCARDSFLNKVAGLAWPAALWKKRLWHRCFPVNVAKFLRTFFWRKFYNFTILFLQKIFEEIFTDYVCKTASILPQDDTNFQTESDLQTENKSLKKYLRRSWYLYLNFVDAFVFKLIQYLKMCYKTDQYTVSQFPHHFNQHTLVRFSHVL